MSLNYGFIASEYRQYDNDKDNTLLAASLMINQQQHQQDEPPSYSAVLAEKYHQQQHQLTTWDIKASICSASIILTQFCIN